jgi:hypothetical protein
MRKLPGQERDHILMALSCGQHQWCVTTVIFAHAIGLVRRRGDEILHYPQPSPFGRKVQRRIAANVWIENRFRVVFEDSFDATDNVLVGRVEREWQAGKKRVH